MTQIINLGALKKPLLFPRQKVSIRNYGVLLVALILLASAGSPAAQQNQQQPELPPLKDVQVKESVKAGTAEKRAGIGDIITVTVKNLKNLVNYAACQSLDDKPVPGCTKQNIALYLDGREIKDISPESGAPLTNEKDSEGTLQFHLGRSLNSDEAWADLLGNPPLRGFFDKKGVRLSVGLQNGYALNTSVDDFTLARADNDFWFWAAIVLLVLLLVGVFYLALFTDLLRDFGSSPGGTKKGWAGAEKNNRKPYSLARVQMAFWFVLVVGSFLFIWLVTGASDTITSTTLALIGIGAGTALGAAVIDINKNQDSVSELEKLRKKEKDLQAETVALTTQINDPNTDPAVLSQLQQDEKEKSAQLKAIQDLITEFSSGAKVSDWFLPDILTDETGGVSFHRFQMFVWTTVLGILFIYSVWYRLSMPEFGPTLLALLGISAGTYIGFKIPENNTQKP